MTNIKISVSDRMNDLLQEIGDDLGVKKAELVKNIIVDNLRDYNLRKVRK